MALQPYDVQANSKLDVGGSEGHVLQTDSLITYVGREDGSVSIYQTPWIYENASVVQPENVQPAPNDPQANRIAELEAELAAIRAGNSSPEAVPAPSTASTPESGTGREQA